MDNNLQPHSAGVNYSGMRIVSKNLSYEWFKDIPNNVIWKDFSEESQEEDMLAFMEPFNFPNLSKLKDSLKASGQYTKKQIDEIIAGLSTLPEYNE